MPTTRSCDRRSGGCGKEGAERAEPALPKHVRALQPVPAEPPDVEQIGGRRATRPSTQMVRAALSASAVPVDPTATPSCGSTSDLEGVHQARVATRRLRSDLRTFRSLLEPDVGRAAPGRTAVARRRARAVRDLDVLGERFRAHASTLPDDDAATTPKLLDRLRVQRDEARAAMLSALREDRYAVLLDRVVAAAARAPMVLADVASDARGRRGRLARCRGPGTTCSRACEALGPRSVDGELHDARIRAKRAALRRRGRGPRRAEASAQVREASRCAAGRARASIRMRWWPPRGCVSRPRGPRARVAFTAGELARDRGPLATTGSPPLARCMGRARPTRR